MDYQQFIQFADKLPEGMLLLTNQGQILAANRKASQLLQIKAQELINQNLCILTDEDESRIIQALRPCSRSRTPVQVAVKFSNKSCSMANGFLFSPATTTSTAQIVLRIQKNQPSSSQFHTLNKELQKQARIMRLLKNNRDILHAEEENLRITLNSIGDAVIATDQHGQITRINPKACQLTGWSKDEAIGLDLATVFDIYHESTNEKVANPVEQVIATKNVVELANHTVLISKTGERFHISDSAAPIRNSSNASAQIHGVILVFQDVTERKKSEDELRLLARVFSDTHEGITITNANKEIIDVNPAFCEITGYSREEVIGQNPRILSSGQQPPEFYIEMWQTLEEKGYWQGEVWNRRKSGELYAELLIISALKDDVQKTVNYVGVFTDITNSKRQQEKLNLMAHYDVLTKLPNRALFLDRFDQAVAHSKRTESMLAICFLDLDHFKPINDNYGHEVGDKLLIEVAQRIKSLIREEDTASRQGGDEFTLLLRDIESFEQCEQLLERIRTSLAKPYVIEDYPHEISVSIGTTLYPLDDANLDTLLRHADQAMYQAKLSGRNQQKLFNALDDKQVMQRQHQLLNIKQALTNKEFQLYYQPKVNMKTGKVFGAEALIRWIHPEKGLIPPLDFLPLIESTDLEIQVGGWVINEALQQLDNWQQKGLNLEVSINVSSHHLQSSIFFDQLNDALDRYPNVNSQDLQLEILESSALGDIDAISGIIKSCQNVLGVNVALDDFGTGYSSLTHLRNLPANTIKIDQSFVRDMLEDEEDLALIEGIIGLANTFDREIIAEGVETIEHGVLLMRVGCNCAQGYGIARPMPSDSMIDWVDNFSPNESWSIWSNSDWEMSNLPLVVAQSDHIKWIEEIFHALDGHKLGLKHRELTNHYECRLGGWYYGHGQKHYGNLKEFQELEAIHVDVHKIGHQIIQLYNDDRKDEAVLLAEDLLALKSKVLDSLNTLQKQVNFPKQKE